MFFAWWPDIRVKAYPFKYFKKFYDHAAKSQLEERVFQQAALLQAGLSSAEMSSQALEFRTEM
jgi:hypothetical protein